MLSAKWQPFWLEGDELIKQGKSEGFHSSPSDNHDNGVWLQETEVKLTVTDGHVMVPKAALCMASPVFNTMLNSDFKENQENEVHLVGKSLKTIEFIAKYVDFSMECPMEGKSRFYVVYKIIGTCAKVTQFS